MVVEITMGSGEGWRRNERDGRWIKTVELDAVLQIVEGWGRDNKMQIGCHQPDQDYS